MFSIQEQCSWIFLSVNGFAFTTIIKACAVCRFQISLSVVEANNRVLRAEAAAAVSADKEGTFCSAEQAFKVPKYVWV